MALPSAFIEDMRQVLSTSELEDFVCALTEGDQPTSIRINEEKSLLTSSEIIGSSLIKGDVAWCQTGKYLSERPQFTLDPLLHAGAYYVQEASSQFVCHVIRHIQSLPDSGITADKACTVLDLCASPGGKSTAVLSVLSKDSVLISNEIDRKRARILAENIQKWGNPNVCVTANAPADFHRIKEAFDIIITDVPCSGEGMFRKDSGAIAEWNPAKVRECSSLQKQIVSEIWDSLKPGGFLIYSTCTFNIHEDEENVQFIHDELGGEIMPIPTQPEWHVHPALTGGFAPDVRPESACRFMPHYTQGEGLFMALLRKPLALYSSNNKKKTLSQPKSKLTTDWVNIKGTVLQNAEGTLNFIPQQLMDIYLQLIDNKLYLLSSGIELGIQKGKDLQPSHALALSTAINREAFTTAELDLETALNYLRREAIVLPPDIDRGYVLLTYKNLPLGFVKNIGNRCNSLYPTEWRIRNL